MTSTSTLPPPPKHATLSRPTNATSSSHRIIQKRWVCDVCHVKWFLDFDEACRHEATCQASSQHCDDKETKAAASSLISQEIVADAVETNTSTPIEIINVESSDDSSSKSGEKNKDERPRRSKRVRCPPCPTPVNETSHTQTTCIATSNDVTKKSKRNRVAAIPAFFRPPKATKCDAASSCIVSQEDYEQHILAEQQLQRRRGDGKGSIPTTTESKSKRKPKTADTNDGTKAPPSSAKTTRDKPALSQKLLGEHAAASFFARRKEAAREERERQKKREEARRCTKRREEEKLSSVEGKPSGRIDRREKRMGAVRFPCPSHVLQSVDVAGETSLTTNGGMGPKYPPGRVNLTNPCPEEPTTGLNFFTNDCDLHPSQDLTLRLFSSVFSSPSTPRRPNDARLWTDKHTLTQIPSSVLGASNQESAQKLMRFIQEWKIRRHKSMLAKKSKRKKSGYDSDDSFLDGESSSPTSLFVLTGRTGTGKSRLVHAVSAGLDCALLEISTGEVRGGGALKKRVLESTLSHSSVALMKKRERVTVLTAVESKKEFFDEESESEEEEEERSSLTVILIDEADLLFQEHGDTGFWLALSQLSHKAKSPIILTANSMPHELLFGTIKFEHVELHRPSIEECCAKMKEVAMAEGMVLNPDAAVGAKGGNNGLSLIAEYFQCDIRKIVNEMQLFHVSTANQSPSTEVVVFPRHRKAKPTDSMTDANFEEELDRPVILNIDPAVIPRDRHTLITIQGKNFQRTESATLYLGGKICHHFRVVSDSKILAVCPPLRVPDGVSSGLKYNKSSRDHVIYCLSSKFVDVAVRKRCSNGLVLNSTSCLPPHQSNWIVEYDVLLECSLLEQKLSEKECKRKAKAQRRRLKQAAEDGFLSSDDEFEFEGDTSNSGHHINKAIADDLSDIELGDKASEVSDSIPNQDVDPQVLLNEALSDSMVVDQSSDECIDTTNHLDCSSTLNELHTFAEEFGRLSDVAFLDDALLGIPMLAGAVEGIGSQAIDDIFGDSIPTDPSIDKLCKEKKPPSFESLFTSGLNQDGFFFGAVDAYMTYPCKQRERFLLSNTELYSRGLGALDDVIDHEALDKETSDCTNDNIEASNLELRPLRIQSDDDMFISCQPPATLLLLRAILGNLTQDTAAFYRSIIENEPWLHLRRNEMSSKVLGIMSTILVPENSCTQHDWNNICYGFRHSERFTTEMAQQSRLRICNSSFDHNLALDYLPYLRFIARKENKARLVSQEMMNDVNERSRKSRTSMRRKQCLRAHYLEEFCGKYCDQQRLRQDLTVLGDSYLSEN